MTPERLTKATEARKFCCSNNTWTDWAIEYGGDLISALEAAQERIAKLEALAEAADHASNYIPTKFPDEAEARRVLKDALAARCRRRGA